MGKLKDLKQEAQELKAKISVLLAQSWETGTAQDAADLYNEYWPTLKEVLQFAKDRKLTGKKADAKLQNAIESGDKIYAITSDPAEFAKATNNLKELLDQIDEKVDKVIAVLTFIDRFFREGTKFDDLLDKTVEFLTRVSAIIAKLEEKL